MINCMGKTKSKNQTSKKIQKLNLKIFGHNIVNPINNDFLQFSDRKIFILLGNYY